MKSLQIQPRSRLSHSDKQAASPLTLFPSVSNMSEIRSFEPLNPGRRFACHQDLIDLTVPEDSRRERREEPLAALSTADDENIADVMTDDQKMSLTAHIPAGIPTSMPLPASSQKAARKSLPHAYMRAVGPPPFPEKLRLASDRAKAAAGARAFVTPPSSAMPK